MLAIIVHYNLRKVAANLGPESLFGTAYEACDSDPNLLWDSSDNVGLYMPTGIIGALCFVMFGLMLAKAW